MKSFNIISIRTLSIMIIGLATSLMVSCNKENLNPTPIFHPIQNPNAGQTLGDLISSDPSFSFYLAAVNRVGMLPVLKNQNSVFTMFAPDNNAFIASGIPDVSIIGALPITTVGAIVQYSLIPGIQYKKADISANFPNTQLPTSLKIGTVPGTPLNLEMTTFPTTVNGFWINNIPVTAADIICQNGVMHKTAGLVAPPSKVLWDAISSDPNGTSFFQAAVARADSGESGLSSFAYLMNYPVTNMTVLVPNDAAFQQLIFGTVYAYVLSLTGDPAIATAQATALSSSPAVFSNPALYGVLTAATVRGILAYHLLASDNGTGVFTPGIRVFGNNFSTTPSFYKTMVNSSVAAHPGIMVAPQYTGPMVSGVKFTGMGTFPPGGQPYTGTPANSVSINNAAVNGVYYVIDKVLLPQ